MIKFGIARHIEMIQERESMGHLYQLSPENESLSNVALTPTNITYLDDITERVELFDVPICYHCGWPIYAEEYELHNKNDSVFCWVCRELNEVRNASST